MGAEESRAHLLEIDGGTERDSLQGVA